MKLLKIIILVILIFSLIFSCSLKKPVSFGEYVRISEKSKQEYKNEVTAIITKTDEFRTKKIDFIVYKKYSIGSIRLNRIDSNTCLNCNPDYPLYLIWNENGKTWIQKFDSCGLFFPVELKNSKIVNFINENFEIITSEKIKYYRTDKNTYSMVDHSTFKQFLIVKSDIEIYNHFDVYNLSNDSDDANINYQYNNNLKIIKLDKIVEEEIQELNSQNLFKRDLSQCR